VDLASKEKSLGRLSQKFIQLFLIGNERVVLTDASDKILGETPVPVLPPGTTAAEILKAQNSANKIMKTKIRRLYDIANVLASIGLIVKLNFGNNMNIANKNRPSFKWAYPVSPMEIMERGRAKKVCKSN
jgi:E2F/DP family winged-helix DNA-binding domain.